MPLHNSESITWPVSKLVGALEAPPGAKLRVEIPKFQRHLVWSKDQKRALIESIFRGYPIGAILLYKRPNPGGAGDLFQVVDGLQRASTLLAYSKDPLQYVDVEAVDGDALGGLVEAFGLDLVTVKRALKRWLDTSNGGLDYTALGKVKKILLEELPSDAKPSSDVDDAIGALLNHLSESVNISNVPVPMVIYTGNEGELPEIFERINQQGTKLSKYEIYAAAWMNGSGTVVANPSIRSAISNKYSTLLEQGFSIDGIPDDLELQDFNLFEYLFGLGKVIVSNHPLLFREKTSAAETEPIAFSIVSTVLGNSMNALSSLPQRMPRSDDGLIDPSELEAAILTATSAVEGWLKPYIGLRLNSTSGNPDIVHGELQVASLIARAAIGRWEVREDGAIIEKTDWPKDWASLKACMPQHYVLDVLEETWRGPLYSLLFNRAWTVDDDGREREPSRHYTTPVGEKGWEYALDSWFAKQLAREQRSRSYVRGSDRLFLRVVYTGLVSHLHDAQADFELEHLYPVARLRRVIPRDQPGWPISCISNLALFTKALNREKSAQTISEYLENNQLDPATAEMVQAYLLCEPSEVHIPSEAFDKGAYMAFLEARWVTMRKLAMKNLGVHPAAA